MNRQLILSGIITLLANLLLSAQVITFTGLDQNFPNKWNEDDNWSCGCVPPSGAVIAIDGDSVSITTVDVELYNITLTSGAVLLNRRNLYFENSDTFAISVDASKILNEGEIFVGEAGTQIGDVAIDMTAFSMILNDSVINIDNVYIGLRISFTSKLVNRGLMSVGSIGITLTSSAKGSVENYDSMHLSTASLNSLRIDPEGVFTNHQNARLSLISNILPCIYLRGSRLSNYGKITANGSGRSMQIRNGATVDLFDGSLILEEVGGINPIVNLSLEAGGALFISPNAELKITPSPQSEPLRLELGGIFECDGKLEVNTN